MGMREMKYRSLATQTSRDSLAAEIARFKSNPLDAEGAREVWKRHGLLPPPYGMKSYGVVAVAVRLLELEHELVSLRVAARGRKP